LAPGDRLPNIGELYAYSTELEDKITRLSRVDTIRNRETHIRTKSKDTVRVLDTTWAIREERGSHFDPDVVDVFLESEEIFNRIRMFESFRENPESIDDLLRPGSAPRG
jgi:HD-GYP domain-containing protein (c-di-GMP phosphodiesterase class II)